MISFLAIGDVHISDRHLAMTAEAMKRTLELVTKRQDVGFIVVMGDVFDRHANVKLQHMKMAFDWLKSIAAIKRTYVLVGNHDRVDNKDFLSDIHPYMGMSSVENLYIVSKPTIVRVHQKYMVAFVPYVAPGRFKEAIDWYIDAKHKRKELLHVKSVNDIDLIFGHQDFYGAPHGPITSTTGDKWPLNYPMVISGHIHSRMWLQDNVFYTVKISEGNDKGVIFGNYNPSSRKMDISVTKVVTSIKEIRRFTTKDTDSVAEMISLDRENTKYVVQGTVDEVAVVRNMCKGKKINVVYDVRPTISKNSESLSYNQILNNLLQDESLRLLLEQLA
jgi:DNA repair exonuclease SbcCD nuclease subunit